MPTLARIAFFPIKSLDGQDVAQADVLPSGALRADRRFALVDSDGGYWNSKRTDKLHAIRSAVDLDHQRLELTYRGEVSTFTLDEDREEIEQYFSLLLHERVRLMENVTQGFPDDVNAPGPTVVSTGTLETIATWFPELTLGEVRRRFRANLEIGDVEPFWEDRLVGEKGPVPFGVGDLRFEGVNLCQRCVVPSRDSHTGAGVTGFAKRFAELREQNLPQWAARSRFDHYYRLAVNTRLAEGSAGGQIRVGDQVQVLQ
jgi:uncharacterized protein YcbX